MLRQINVSAFIAVLGCVGFASHSVYVSKTTTKHMKVLLEDSARLSMLAYYRGCKDAGSTGCKEKATTYVKDTEEIYQKVDEVSREK